MKPSTLGRVLRIADLVDDDPSKRDRVSTALKDPAQKNKGLQEDKASSSPIMSTIQRIAIEKFSSRAVSDLPKSLFVVSDMIEHSLTCH